MKILLTSFAVVVVAVAWTVQRTATERLQLQIDGLREQRRELTAVRAENERLRAEEIDAAEWETLKRGAAERSRLRRELDDRDATARSQQTNSLAKGDWVSAPAWKNLGQASPSNAMETLLWAAAGGDVTTLKDLLLLEGPVRAQAMDLLARLPSDTRLRYATPEQLVAAFTLKAIPLGEAQLVWQQENGPDDAVACLVLSEPLPANANAAPTEPSKNAPPMLTSKSKITSAYVGLRRGDGGWRLVVPASAIEKIQKELSGKSGP